MIQAAVDRAAAVMPHVGVKLALVTASTTELKREKASLPSRRKAERPGLELQNPSGAHGVHDAESGCGSEIDDHDRPEERPHARCRATTANKDEDGDRDDQRRRCSR
jgi:hypothetical protein